MSDPTRRPQARIVERTALHEGFLKLYRYVFEVDQHGGGAQRRTWEVMERGHAVAVLGHDPVREEVVLVNEFRPGVLLAGDYPFRDNLVAGGIEESESPLDAAVREMREEAGLELREPELIHAGAFVSSGGTSEKSPSCTARWIRAAPAVCMEPKRSTRIFSASCCRRASSSSACAARRSPTSRRSLRDTGWRNGSPLAPSRQHVVAGPSSGCVASAAEP